MTVILTPDGGNSALFQPSLETPHNPHLPNTITETQTAFAHSASEPHFSSPSRVNSTVPAVVDLPLLSDMKLNGDSLFVHENSLSYFPTPLKSMDCLEISQAWTRDAIDQRVQIVTGQNLEHRDLSRPTEKPEPTASQRTLKPPAKDAKPSPKTVKQLREWLRLRLAGGPMAKSTFSFYEDIDAYLGPWGDKGYPLEYGKKYNHAFMVNERLGTNPNTRQWMEKAGLNLQKELLDFIVQRYEKGTLAQLSEPELRHFAFESHPRAYIQGGLPNLLLTAPELLPFVIAVPKAEFSPQARDFDASIKQVAVSAMGSIPRALNLFTSCLGVDPQKILDQQDNQIISLDDLSKRP